MNISEYTLYTYILVSYGNGLLCEDRKVEIVYGPTLMSFMRKCVSCSPLFGKQKGKTQ